MLISEERLVFAKVRNVGQIKPVVAVGDVLSECGVAVARE
jgi:hypothetical protein